MAEIVVDEWLIDYLSPASIHGQVEMAHAITQFIKSKCDKMIFTPAHFRNFQSKVEQFKKNAATSFHYPLLLRPLTMLLFDSEKVDRRSGFIPQDVKGVKDDDFPVVESAFAISIQRKLIVTTDEPLSKVISENCGKYGLECLKPEGYLNNHSQSLAK
jgi:hypothetical protein